MLSDDAKQKFWFLCIFVFIALFLFTTFRELYLIRIGQTRFTPNGILMEIRKPSLKRPKYDWSRKDTRTVVLPRLYPIFRFAGPAYWLVMALYSFIIQVLYKSSNQCLRQRMAKGWLLGSLLWFGMDFYIRWQAWHR